MKRLLFIFKCGQLVVWLLISLLLLSCAQQKPQLNTNATVIDKIEDFAGMQLAWSPDGQVLSTFVGNPAVEMVRLALLDLDTKTIRNLGAQEWWYGEGNHWSPDGTRILVTRDKGIWLVRVADSQATYLTNGEDAAWFPDGQTLAVFRTPETGGLPDRFQIVIVMLDGKEIRTFLAGVIQPPKPPPSPPSTEPGDQRLMPVTASFAPYYTGMSVSPDGQSVVYGIGFPDEQRDDLFILNFDDSEPRRLNLDGFNDEPAWSPKGDRIAYIHSPDRVTGDLYLFSLDSVCQLRLTTGGYTRYPTWSPDGRRIALVARGHVYILDVEKYLSDEYFNPEACK